VEIDLCNMSMDYRDLSLYLDILTHLLISLSLNSPPPPLNNNACSLINLNQIYIAQFFYFLFQFLLFISILLICLFADFWFGILTQVLIWILVWFWMLWVVWAWCFGRWRIYVYLAVWRVCWVLGRRRLCYLLVDLASLFLVFACYFRLIVKTINLI
jgi:hypothetical protein